MERLFPDDFLTGLSAAVGFVVVNWSQVEINLDYWSGIAFRQAGGNAIAKKLPRTFTNKVDFLQSCFGRLPTLATHRVEATNLIARASKLARTRNWLAHGVITNYEPQEHLLTYIKLDSPQRTVHSAANRVFRLHEILKAGEDIQDLVTEMLDLTNRLLQVELNRSTPDT